MNIICGYGTLVLRERVVELHEEQTKAKIRDFQQLLYLGKYASQEFWYEKINGLSKRVISTYGISPESGNGYEKNERRVERIGRKSRERANYLGRKQILTPQEESELESLNLPYGIPLIGSDLTIGLIVDLSGRLRRLFYVASLKPPGEQYRVDTIIRKVLGQDVGVSSSDIEKVARITTSPDQNRREEVLQSMHDRMHRLIEISGEKNLVSWIRGDKKEPAKYLLAHDILAPHLDWVGKYPEFHSD